MALTPDDTIRPFQLPGNTPEQAYLSQYNLANNTPILITPGFGASGLGQLPPIWTGSSHFEITITSYVEAAQSEVLN